MSLYLFDVYGSKSRAAEPGKPRPKAIDLGAGVGLTAHVMAMLGFDVVATDLKVVIDAVLRENIGGNGDHVKTWGKETLTGGVAKGCGIVGVKELDWLVEPSEWDWSGVTSIAPRDELGESGAEDTISPPFDLIVTADTLYHQDLVFPLLRAIKALSIQSKVGKKCPPVLVALERRDPEVIRYALNLAKEEKFECKKVPDGKLKKCLDAAGMKWSKVDWDGVEIWRWTFRSE